MTYIREFCQGQLKKQSRLIIGVCDACEAHNIIVQELPAEENAGESFFVQLCKKCLIRLSKEF